MWHTNTKKYKLYKSLYDMVTYKMKVVPSPSKPLNKNDDKSDQEEEKESDHLS